METFYDKHGKLIKEGHTIKEIHLRGNPLRMWGKVERINEELFYTDSLGRICPVGSLWLKEFEISYKNENIQE